MNQNENTRKSEDQKFTKTAPGEKQDPKKAEQTVSPKPGENGIGRQAPENKPL